MEKGNLHLSLHMEKKKKSELYNQIKIERPHTPLMLPAFQSGIKILE